MAQVPGPTDGDATLADKEQSLGPQIPQTSDGQRPDRIAHFVVLERIGAGGMGVVYTAYDPRLDRRVALKLVQATSRGEAAKIRLLREAQGMARISHPNVVPVFEAGTHANAVWLAMEFVEGGTLSTWLETPRDWRAIVTCFIGAGRGLAAAHTAGLVHRDFKPDNVLIGGDGRPQVADFGLVRPTELPPADTAPPIDALPPLDHLDALDGSTGLAQSVTHAGAMLGTPRYMSPEQIAGAGVGPHSDQFSFCVALYRALFDQAPFPGDTVMELLTNVVEAKLRPPPRDTPVPRSIVDAVTQGLAHDPADRFATIDELLDALEPPSPRRWGVVLALLTLSAVIGTLVAVLATHGSSPVPLCIEGPERLEGIWDAEVRARVEHEFDALELAYGPESFELATTSLDRWATGWVTQYTDACEATHVRGDQSDATLDLRMTCLDDHRRATRTIVELLAAPDAALIERTWKLVAELPDPTACARLDELRAIAPPTPEQAPAVARVREGIARARALTSTGRTLDARRTLAELETATLDHTPTIAALRFYQSFLVDDHSSASEPAAEAFAQALQVGHDELALEIATHMISFDGGLSEDRGLIASERWFTIADALAERRGRPLRPELLLADHRARQLSRLTRFDEAIATARYAVRLAERGYGPDSVELAPYCRLLAGSLSNAGHYREANEVYERASQLYQDTLGPNHPRLLKLLLTRSLVADRLGKHEQSRADLLHMVELSERVRGPNDTITLAGLSALAVNYDLTGEPELARSIFEDLLARLGQREAPRSRLALETSNSLCFVLYKLGEYDEARELCEAALVSARKISTGIAAIILNNLGLIARAEGQLEDALAHDREALALAEDTLGPKHILTSYSLVGIGESLLMSELPEQAIAPLERALALRERAEIPGELAEVRCLLAHALLESSDDRSRALELLEHSAEGFSSAGKDWDARAQSCAALMP